MPRRARGRPPASFSMLTARTEKTLRDEGDQVLRHYWRTTIHITCPSVVNVAMGESSALSSAVNAALLTSLLALVPTSLLLTGSAVVFFRRRSVSSFMQLIGAGCLVVVAVAHICEALRLFPAMHWGLEHSAGHYLDLSSAVLGLTLFPIGYLLQALKKPRARA
jgi:succinate dehydrogenase/fumarate reductase cytochrome b subunit